LKKPRRATNTQYKPRIMGYEFFLDFSRTRYKKKGTWVVLFEGNKPSKNHQSPPVKFSRHLCRSLLRPLKPRQKRWIGRIR